MRSSKKKNEVKEIESADHICSECSKPIPDKETTCSIECWNDRYDRLQAEAIQRDIESEYGGEK